MSRAWPDLILAALLVRAGVEYLCSEFAGRRRRSEPHDLRPGDLVRLEEGETIGVRPSVRRALQLDDEGDAW